MVAVSPPVSAPPPVLPLSSIASVSVIGPSGAGSLKLTIEVKSVFSSALICAIVPVMVTEAVPLFVDNRAAGAGRHGKRAVIHRQRDGFRARITVNVADRQALVLQVDRIARRAVKASGVIVETGASFTAVRLIVEVSLPVSAPPVPVLPPSSICSVSVVLAAGLSLLST